MSNPVPARRAGLAVAIAIATFALLLVLQTTARAAGTQVLRISARSHMILRFNVSRLSAHPGRITIVMTNPRNAGMAHGIAVQGNGVNRGGRIVGPGGTSTVTVTLRRGHYTYFCPVPGHRAAGMKGTLTIR